MKKLATKLCIGGVLLTIILCGCTSAPDPVFDSSQAVQDWNGVHLELRQYVCPQDVLKLEFTFKNETKYYLNYGSKWQLERYDIKGNLSLCPYDSDFLFHESLCILPPNVSETISINFSNYRRYLRPGRYRIAFGPINATKEDLGEINQEILDQFILYADFSIETAVEFDSTIALKPELRQK